MWVMLNDLGKAAWGDIFPTGKIPVLSFEFHTADLEDQKHQRGGTMRVIMVNWGQLSAQQHIAIIEKIHKKTGASQPLIQNDIEKYGLPLREAYTTGCVAAELRFFI